MRDKKERSKKERVAAEIKRLRKTFSDMDKERSILSEKLIEKAAFQWIEIEDLQEFLDENGWDEKFKQGKDQEPYDRKRPKADVYISLSAQYDKTIKQLNDMLPKVKNMDLSLHGDGFDDFVNNRGDK